MVGLTPAVVDAGAEPGFDTNLEAQLLESIRADSTQARNEPIRFAMHAADGVLLAGLSGRTSYGWLHLDMLWVAPDHRKKGYGRKLVTRAFDKARSLGCHSAWLDTSTPAAFDAWQKLGFSEFGRLTNVAGQHPERHQRWFMRTSLT